AFGLTRHMNRHLQSQLGAKSDTDQVYVQQSTADGLRLPIANHGACWGFPPNFQGENGVMAGLRMKDFADANGIDRNRDDRAAAAVDHAWDASQAPRSPGCVLAEILARFRFHRQYLTHSFPLLRVRVVPAPFRSPTVAPPFGAAHVGLKPGATSRRYMKSLLTDVSS